MTDIPYLLIEHIAGLIILPEKAYFKISIAPGFEGFLVLPMSVCHFVILLIPSILSISELSHPIHLLGLAAAV
jgi:hypothetical protein